MNWVLKILGLVVVFILFVNSAFTLLDMSVSVAALYYKNNPGYNISIGVNTDIAEVLTKYAKISYLPSGIIAGLSLNYNSGSESIGLKDSTFGSIKIWHLNINTEFGYRLLISEFLHFLKDYDILTGLMLETGFGYGNVSLNYNIDQVIPFDNMGLSLSPRIEILSLRRAYNYSAGIAIGTRLMLGVKFEMNNPFVGIVIHYNLF